MAFRRILLDIEGTVSPLAFVQEVLFPWARREIPRYLRQTPVPPELGPVLDQMARDDGAPDFGGWCPHPVGSVEAADWVMARVGAWMDADAKKTGLKALQGLVWEAGYLDGSLKAPVFPDVPGAIQRWRRAGFELGVYSSGSVPAQKLFFAHTSAGDLTPCISRWNDTTIGGKREAASYLRIAAEWNSPAGDFLFLSDVPEELAAAREAGMAGGLVLRPGNRPVGEGFRPRIATFDEVDALLS
jgi:enolase-phosphatase E1